MLSLYRAGCTSQNKHSNRKEKEQKGKSKKNDSIRYREILIHFSQVMETEHINKSPSYFICSQISVRSSVLADW